MNNKKSKAGKQEIRISDNIPGAEYANAMQVKHDKYEFQLAFLNITPPNGRVVGKIITNPGHFKRMISAMQENLKKYEEKFGEIKETLDQDDEIGFKPNN